MLEDEKSPLIKRKRPAARLPKTCDNNNNFIHQTVYFLNSVKSKSVCIGFDPTRDFEAVVQFSQTNKKYVVISKSEWSSIVTQKQLVNDFFSSGVKKPLPFRWVSYANYFGCRYLLIKKRINLEGGSFNINSEEWDNLLKLLELITLTLDSLTNESINLKRFLADSSITPSGSKLDFQRLKIELSSVCV